MQLFYFVIFVVILGALIEILSSPIFWAIVGFGVVFVIVVICKLNSKQKEDIRVSNYREWSKSVSKNKKNTNKKSELDEEISTAELIKVRDMLNSIFLGKKLTNKRREEIINKLLSVNSTEFTEETANQVRNLDLNAAQRFFVEFKTLLNSKKIEQTNKITGKEFIEDLEEKIRLEQSETDEYLDDDSQEYYDDSEEDDVYEDEDYSYNESAKQKRIKNLRKDVRKLNDEYKFERGYDPDWDEDDRLSEKYRNDEEKYLRARKLELEERNRSYDNYMSPEERMNNGETDEQW